jgi:hypothetical protein
MNKLNDADAIAAEISLRGWTDLNPGYEGHGQRFEGAEMTDMVWTKLGGDPFNGRTSGDDIMRAISDILSRYE